MARYTGYETVLSVDNTGSGSYVAVAQVRDVTGPTMQQAAVEVTTRDGNKWRQFTGGLRDGGEVTFELVYDPDLATHAAGAAPGLVNLLTTGTSRSFRLAFSDTTPATATFTALVTTFTPKAPLADAMLADCTIKVSGAVTWA